ncbi:MAG: hypothetical protein JZU65_19740, partial [Chlorobium sp.]|nr:hypothetical protein [Chlorobium sp.]
MILKFCKVKNECGLLSSSLLNALKLINGATSFIETGTYQGDTVNSLVSLFDKLYSIELSDSLYEKAKKKNLDIPSITILHGDSAVRLAESIELSKGTFQIFWLDAHYSGEGTARGLSNTPVLKEIETICMAGNSQSIVLIDDIRMFKDKFANGFRKHEAVSGYPRLEKVFDLLNNFGIGFDCYVYGDILVALP